MSKPFKTCILHIGTGKTGSTSIQYNFALYSKEIKKYSIYYPPHWRSNNIDQVIQSKNSTRRKTEGRDTIATFSSDYHFFLKQLMLEEGALDCDTLILSSEHLAGESEGAILALKNLVGKLADEVKIVVYFRRQDRHAISHFGERAENNISLFKTGLKGFNKQQMFHPARGHNYADTCEKWLKLWKEASLIPRIFDKSILVGGDVVLDFAHVVGIKQMPELKHTFNRSLGLEQLNLLIDYFDSARLSSPLSAEQRRIKHMLMEVFPFINKLNATSEDAAKYYERFHEQNLRLSQIMGAATVPFAEDFSDYPNTHDYEARYDASVWYECLYDQRLIKLMNQEPDIDRFVNYNLTGVLHGA